MARIDVVSQYLTTFRGTGAAAGTSSGFVALVTDSGEKIQIIRVRVTTTDTTWVDNIRVQLRNNTTLGSTPVDGSTPIKKNPTAPESVTATKVKDGSNTWTSGSGDIVHDDGFTGRGIYEWTALDDEDKIIVQDGGIFQVTLTASTTAGLPMMVTVEWKEE